QNTSPNHPPNRHCGLPPRPNRHPHQNPSTEQRLIYQGKQLQPHHTLSQCTLVNDSNLQLLARLKSTVHPHMWQLLVDLVKLILHCCKFGPDCSRKSIDCRFDYLSASEFRFEYESNDFVVKAVLTRVLGFISKDEDAEHCRIFLASFTPQALVTLYTSRFRGNRVMGNNAIRDFVGSLSSSKFLLIMRHCALVVLEFCKLLRIRVGTSDGLYIFCRDSLGCMFGDKGFGRCYVTDLIDVSEFVPFIAEFAAALSSQLVLSMGSEAFVGVSSYDVSRFSLFVNAVSNEILANLGPESGVEAGGCPHDEGMEMLWGVFKYLMGIMDLCLEKMEGRLAVEDKENLGHMSCRWKKYLRILKGLNGLAKMVEGGEELFWGTFMKREASLTYLIFKFAKRTHDQTWILVEKFTNFETRRHLFMMMFPGVKDENHEMLIDRSQLLEESFAYIVNAKIEALHSGLCVEFKHEEATGPGVLREWFYLVCQEIFNPQNALFVACPNDRRRFFPNPASKVDPLHLGYFKFSGRYKLALYLIVYSSYNWLENVCLEDICDADPYLYKSCKTILEMDADMVDQDALGLTFIREGYELGTREVVELCARGENISVTSRNRKKYIDLLIQHSFVTSIAEQVAHFIQGFSDIMDSAHMKTRVLLQKSFFKNINLEELDWMLYGRESALCLEDWRAHTKYVGFQETDPQICWFWKIVGEMSAKRRRRFLSFWTSIKYLPVEGFRGLASQLNIYLTNNSSDHLPSSRTCFYRLSLPPYPSEEIMRDRLQIITQEHVDRSFGIS
ncbi:hypothetical protein Leryth_021304, partial [Lithospermum erythrorhizon]